MEKTEVDLRNEHFKETGNSFTENNKDPSWHYVNWLENNIKELKNKIKHL